MTGRNLKAVALIASSLAATGCYNPTKTNVLDVLEAAWEINKTRMEQLLLSTVAALDPEDLTSFKKLAGIGNYGTISE